MNVEKILVPTDFSPSSEGALEYATILARDFGASLLITHVLPTSVIAGTDDDVFDANEPLLRARLEAVKPRDSHVSCKHHFTHGVPSRAIVHLAQQEGVQLIVMGAHGETSSRSEPMGEVARHVVIEAPCPVLTFSRALVTAPATNS